MSPLTVLITGATTGFGEAIARRYLDEGHKVIATGRREERLSALKSSLPAFKQSLLHTHTLDVTDHAAVLRLATELPQNFAAVDILINNAGLALGIEVAQQASLEDWQRMVATNINGLLFMTHYFLPGMIERGKGHIINLGSVAADYPYPGGNVYGATKAFVRQFTQNLKADLLKTPIRVTDISPGLCSGTEFSYVRFKGDTKKAAQVYEGTKAITADDIAEAVYWTSTLPSHVNINLLEIMPTCQAPGPFAIDRSRPPEL